MRTLAWVAGISIASLFVYGTTALVMTPTKVAQPEFVPGQHITIRAGSWTIDATVVGPVREMIAKK